MVQGSGFVVHLVFEVGLRLRIFSSYRVLGRSSQYGLSIAVNDLLCPKELVEKNPPNPVVEAQLQAFWHWLEESALPVGELAGEDPITLLKSVKQRNPGLGKVPPSFIAALAWLHPYVATASSWGQSATEVLQVQLPVALVSIKQSWHVQPRHRDSSAASSAAPASSSAARAQAEPQRIRAEHPAVQQFLRSIHEMFVKGIWDRDFDSQWNEAYA